MKPFLLNALTSIALVLPVGYASAQASPTFSTDDSVTDVVQRYPAGSIQSSEAANAAIKAVTAIREKIEKNHKDAQQACYPRFFMTACMNKATEQRRQEMSAVRPIELEANSYIRHERVRERDQRLEENAKARAERNAAYPVIPAPSRKDLSEDTDTSDAQRAARAQAHAEKNAQRTERERERDASSQADAEKRARNLERYEEKVRESQERQKEVERRRMERAAGK